jgi:hypothetical protein
MWGTGMVQNAVLIVRMVLIALISPGLIFTLAGKVCHIAFALFFLVCRQVQPYFIAK